MVDEPQYLTQEGMEALEKRLRHLLDVRRPQVAERLRLALEEGGELTENSEYEDAKNEQAFIEGEIMRLEGILSSAQIIQEDVDRDEVVPGARVTIMEKGTDMEEVYHLVGSAEANPREGKISVVSPMGKALLGAKVGDRVTVRTPDGEVVFKIKAIE
ncbi:MAG: transcription elongation factor GreA [Chloroflexota bacterium]